MSKTFVTSWSDTPFLDEEDAEVSLATAQEISDVIDAIIFSAVGDQETDGSVIKADLLASASNLESGLADTEQRGPLLLESLADVTVVGVSYADTTETSPPGTLLRAAFISFFDFSELEERPEHLDDAVEDYFSNQNWVT